MNEAEHRKKLLIQQIEHQRELLRLEMGVMRESNPATMMIGSVRQVVGLVHAVSPRGRSRSGASVGGSVGARLSQLDLEHVTTAMAVVLRILRVALQRRHEKRAVKA